MWGSASCRSLYTGQTLLSAAPHLQSRPTNQQRPRGEVGSSAEMVSDRECCLTAVFLRGGGSPGGTWVVTQLLDSPNKKIDPGVLCMQLPVEYCWQLSCLLVDIQQNYGRKLGPHLKNKAKGTCQSVFVFSLFSFKIKKL